MPQAARLCRVPSTITHGRAAVFTAGRQIDYRLAAIRDCSEPPDRHLGRTALAIGRFAPPGGPCAGAEPVPATQ
jgi:hypothetical protein